jgi:integrase
LVTVRWPAKGEQLLLTHPQLESFADAAGRDRLVILFLGYTGVRYGEMAALRVHNLDLLRRRALIAEAVADVNGRAGFDTPKNHQRRTVLHLRNFRRRSFDPAVQVMGLDGLTPHALWHTAASLAIAAGANVKVVQTMLGHKSATMTPDLYGHLFADQLDQVADAMDAARTSLQDHADFVRTKPIVRDLDEARQRAGGQ